MSFVQLDIDEFDRVTLLAHIAAKLNRIEATASERGEHYSATSIAKLVGEIGSHIRKAADDAVTDPAAIRAMFEADARAEGGEFDADAAAEFAAGEARGGDE